MTIPPQPADLGLTQALLTRTKGLQSTALIIRVAIATTFSFFLAQELSGSNLPIFAPVTTLLVVQASPFTTLGIMAQRVLGTLLGVAAGTLYVYFVPVAWWSVLLALLVALFAARQLPVGIPGQMQLPIALVFVLALGAGDLRTDLWRILDVLIGAGVGAVAVFIAPPKPRLQGAVDAVGAYVNALVDVIRSVATAVTHDSASLRPDQRHEFIASSRALRPQVERARDAFTDGVESTRFNLRSADADVDLIRLSETLDWAARLAIQIRALAGGIDRLYDRSDIRPTLPGTTLAPLLDSLADLISAQYDQRDDEVDRISAELEQALRAATHDCVAARPDIADTLDSIGVLGRIEHLRERVEAGPLEHLEPEDEMPPPRPSSRWRLGRRG